MKTRSLNHNSAEDLKEIFWHFPAVNNPESTIGPFNPSASPSDGFAYRVFFAAVLIGLFVNIGYGSAQDPVLPPTNLGLANIYDGFAGKPDWVYQGYVQAFDTKHFADGSANRAPSTLKINSVVSLNQLIYLTPVKIVGGNLGFTVIVPVVQINASNLNGPAPTVNPGFLGDIVQGTAVQWSDKKLFGKAFFHRIEIDLTLPTGSYDSRYKINASSHRYAFGAYHAFTIFLNKEISLSARNQFNYNAHMIGQQAKAGAYYNGNYSIDYSLFKSFKIEAAAYFLDQLNQNSYAGNHYYYADQFDIASTKERVLGVGPGLAILHRTVYWLKLKYFLKLVPETALRETGQHCVLQSHYRNNNSLSPKIKPPVMEAFAIVNFLSLMIKKLISIRL
ncbi:SphA family protein [Dyadobacter sp. OTU695]|uniref:SphA family protein n=1 Tax=Dyadobacter sp. OTU695 TaxID=3043860 RepID=UPI00313BA849